MNKSGYGHYTVSIELEGKTLSATTSNMRAIDAAMMDDEDIEADNFYETKEQGQTALIDFILDMSEVGYTKEDDFYCF